MTRPSDWPATAEEVALAARLKAAVVQYAAMSAVDKALHDDGQRRSFVRGQLGYDPGPGVLAEEVRRQSSYIAELEAALKEIAWSNDSKWQADRAAYALQKGADHA